MTQKQIETFGIWFIRINHLIYMICAIAAFACAEHDQFFLATGAIQYRRLIYGS